MGASYLGNRRAPVFPHRCDCTGGRERNHQSARYERTTPPRSRRRPPRVRNVANGVSERRHATPGHRQHFPLATKTIEPPAEDLDKQEITRIFTNSLSARGALAPADSDYIAHIVVRRTGVDLADAQARVAATWSRLLDKANALDEAVRAAAEKARKAAVDVSLWLFISLLMGAFAACLLATVGGRTRAL